MDVQHNRDRQRDAGCAMEDGGATGIQVCNGGWMDVQHNWGVQWSLDVEQDFGCATEAARATGLWVCNGGWTCNGTLGVQCTLDVQH